MCVCTELLLQTLAIKRSEHCFANEKRLEYASIFEILLLEIFNHNFLMQKELFSLHIL